VLLLDEPLSNLDAKLPREMRSEIVPMKHRPRPSSSRTTKEDAFALADRVAVMNRRCIEQVGSPEEIYTPPATAFVAKFLGQPNALPIEVAGMNGGRTIYRLADRTVVSQSARLCR
jgi:ABC-type Fe3+/spermidine/putrescine transport system ATPase subunit